ncbi:GHKL domain-containing protein [Ruminococcaceae bacterium OttesenSCG-928-L11]|nr:GHKL domain-containing protein [Ruminococcaceae bacterium OttesenSCG-928-L11]
MEAAGQTPGEAALTARTERRYRPAHLVCMLLAVVAASSCLFWGCWRWDNKYTAPGKQPSGGVLTLTDGDLRENPVVFLVRDWEIYRGRLLTPEDFQGSGPNPDELTFIGQYGGFEGADRTASPHGMATYRLRIRLPEEQRSYTLELPEIYTAYRLYLNGVLMRQMGDPRPESHRPQTGNSSVTVQAAGELDVLITVSDYRYFYSGMLYPPAFGEPAAVAGYLNRRYGLRVAALAAAFCIGVLALCIRAMTKPPAEGEQENPLLLLYGLLCVCFIGYTCYPVVKTLWPGGLQWYYLENLCYSGMFLLVILIQRRISGFGNRATAAMTMLGVFVCCCSLATPALLSGNMTLMLAYSHLLNLYTYASAVFLTASAVYGVYRGTVYSPILLAGIAVYDCALVWDRLLAGHEPIQLGWFREMASGILILLIGVVMAREIARQFRLRLVLEGQVENAARVMELQSAYYSVLLEKEQEAKAMRHDLRHHFRMLRELAVQGNLDALTLYLDEYDDAYLARGAESYCGHEVTDMVLRLYAGMAEQRGVALTVDVRVPQDMDIGSVDLCVVLSNLLENALEACDELPEESRWIRIGIVWQMSRLSIVMDNSFDGVAPVTGGRYLSRKRGSFTGVGLTSIQAVAARHGGTAHFYPDRDRPVFHSEIVLVVRQARVPQSIN